MKILLIILLLIIGCAVRPLGDISIISTKELNMEANYINVYSNFEGKSVQHIVIFFPTGLSPTIEEAVDKGKVMLLDIDVKGGCSIMDEFDGDTISIFIEPPGEDINEQIEALEKRLKNRGHESETLIKQRTKRMQLELEYKDKFDHHFVNENLKETTDKIEKLIRRKNK